MKTKISRNVRLVFICITVILAGLFSYLLYMEISKVGFAEEKVAVYKYINKTGINYKVFLKPNILYDYEYMGENEVYITNLVRYIQASFQYSFEGEETADISGDYEILAYVEGYKTHRETVRTIWRKEFVIIPKTAFEAKEKTMSIIKEVPVNLEEYNYFASQVKEISNINSPVKLSVFMNINLRADTGKGIIKEKLSPAIIIPLNTSYFEIEKSRAEEKHGVIEEIKRIEHPSDKRMLVLYGIMLSISVIALLYLIFFTSKAKEKDPLLNIVDKIFKQYGSRMVALNSEITTACEAYNNVKSMDDLVRLADDAGKPILYKYSSDYKCITKFYVVDNSTAYVFDLKHSADNSELNNPATLVP